MTATPFQPAPAETVLFQSQPARKWHVLLWRIGGGLIGIVAFSLVSIFVLTGLAETLLVNIIPAEAANIIGPILCVGITPLLAVAYVAEDVTRAFTSEFVLTNRRVWVRGSPYAWIPPQEIPLEEIESMVFHRDAIFLRTKSNPKVQVHMFPDGKLIVKAYDQLKKGAKSGRK